MVSAALQICLAYYIISILDPYIMSWQCLNRPIVVAPLAGLILGDFKTGIIMGSIPGIHFHGNFRHRGLDPGRCDNLQHHRSRLHYFNWRRYRSGSGRLPCQSVRSWRPSLACSRRSGLLLRRIGKSWLQNAIRVNSRSRRLVFPA